MPFILLAIGAVFLVAGIRGTHADYQVDGVSYPGLFTLIKGDFSGQANFLYWFAAIFLIGCVGYIQPLKKVSDSFIVLVIVSMFVAKSNNGVTGGFFTKFIQALQTPATNAPSNVFSNTTGQTTSTANAAAALQPLQGITIPQLNIGQILPDATAIGGF